MKNIIDQIEVSIYNNWNSIALSDYPGDSKSFGDLALSIERLHKYWKGIGIKKGDKVGIFANNGIPWLEVYLAALTGGYIAILIPTNFTFDIVLQCLHRSNCKILYVERAMCPLFQKSDICIPITIVDISSLEIVYSWHNFPAYKFIPLVNDVERNNFHFDLFPIDSVCTIMYTSGSFGTPKGVELSYRNISYNVATACDIFPYQGSRYHVNILPFTHIYGAMCDALAPLCLGAHLIICHQTSKSEFLVPVLQEFKPSVFFTVPIMVQELVYCVINKIPALGENAINPQLFADKFIGKEIRDEISAAFGQNIQLIVTGGASISREMESFFIHTLKLPFVTGYGITECGPIAAGSVMHYQERSCGEIINKSGIRISKTTPLSCTGEIQVKGDNVFVGYHRDPIATKAVFTEDGWFKTGDLGYIDDEGNLFITGRCKDMLLTSNGENIYPEEVESIVNASPYVKESILVQRGEKLYAIVVPDREEAEADGLDAEGLNKKIDEAVREASKKLPGFTIISGFELRDEPLERTPKGSLKRFLYS